MNNYPENFSWIDNFVAGSSIPIHIDHIEFFKSNGITHVISLTSTIPLVMKYTKKISHVHIPIYSTPDNHQLFQIKKLLRDIKSESGKIVVHCQYGQERTGIFLAIYLILFYNLTPKEAIKKIRKKRPGSLRTFAAAQYIERLTLDHI